MISTSHINRCFALAGAAAVLAIFHFSMPAIAATGASIKGQWAGTGSVKQTSGDEERVRCRVTYGRISGQDFSLKARCATNAARIDQSGQLKRVSNNRYVGRVHNELFNISAKVLVTVSGQRQKVDILSENGSASLVLNRR